MCNVPCEMCGDYPDCELNERSNPCAFCAYSDERIEPVNGVTYYVCTVDNPDDYPDARCC